jgi:DNA-binding MarR family transcriptional regulator
MLLDLYAATLDRRSITVSSLCIAAAVPATTALRWIKSLTSQGLFARVPDRHDARRIYVTLTPKSLAALNRYFARAPRVPQFV